MKIRKFVGFFIALALCFGVISPVQAFQQNIGIDRIGTENDVQVNAPYSSVVFDFPVPRLAQLQAATLTAFVSPGSQLHGNNLFFFYYNDQLIATRTAKELREQKPLVLNLPVDGIARDFAKVQIKSNLFITDDLCRDYYSGGLFFTVHKNTSLNLTYEMLQVRTIADFLGNLQQSLLIVAPDNANMEEFTPGAWTYGLMRKAYPYLDVQLVRASELPKNSPVPRIWVGIDSKLPEYFKGSVSGITLKDANTLLISAGDVKALASHVRQLADLHLFPLNPTDSKRIKVTPLEKSAGQETEAIAFGSNIAQDGIQVVASFFQLTPALLKNIPERLGLHLEGAYTVATDEARAVRLDVFVNNSLVHSSNLDNTGKFKQDVLLPESVEIRARNDMSIQFTYPDQTGQCRVRGKTQSIQIFPNSYMWGSGQYKAERFTWNNIGLFWGRKGIVLMDETLGSNLLKIAGEIAYFMDLQLPPRMAAFPEFAPLTQQSAAPESGYVLLAGMTGNIPAALQDKMPVALGKDFTLYRKTTQSTEFEYKATVNSVVGRIGENKGAPLVILSANLNGDLFLETLRYLNRSRNYETLIGNVWVYQQPNRLYSFDVRDRSVRVEKPATQGTFTAFWNQNRTLIFIAAGILILLLLLALVYRLVFPGRKRPAKETVRSDESYTPFKPGNGNSNK